MYLKMSVFYGFLSSTKIPAEFSEKICALIFSRFSEAELRQTKLTKRQVSVRPSPVFLASEQIIFRENVVE